MSKCNLPKHGEPINLLDPFMVCIELLSRMKQEWLYDL